MTVNVGGSVTHMQSYFKLLSLVTVGGIYANISVYTGEGANYTYNLLFKHEKYTCQQTKILYSSFYLVGGRPILSIPSFPAPRVQEAL